VAECGGRSTGDEATATKEILVEVEEVIDDITLRIIIIDEEHNLRIYR
jgi:hypothetical protein